MDKPLLKVWEHGQSVWLDFLRRDLLESGRLKRMIDEDGLRGVTVNPSILDQAIRKTDDYREAIEALLEENEPPGRIYERLAVDDVRSAADAFARVYEASDGRDGFVSLEVSPYLAHDTAGTIEEATRFWGDVDRPNLMVKVPATLEGLDAIRRLTADGINVNATLLFGLPRYQEVAQAYIAGIEERVSRRLAVDRVSSVASFFVSRIDVMLDPMLDAIAEQGGTRGKLAAGLRGQVAISSAKVAYQIFRRIFENGGFSSLAAGEARAQRLLWASTSTKDPSYSDVKYVDELIGARTVNTMPVDTLDAYRDHGDPAPRLTEDVDRAYEVLEQLEEVGIEIDAVTKQLEEEGVDRFAASYDRLMQALAQPKPAAA
jgi:transaldolase